MLRGISEIITPDLLFVLASMGHGDELAVVDRNYPAASGPRPVVHLAGVDLPGAVRAITSLFPLDTFALEPVARMEPVDAPASVPGVQREVIELIEQTYGRRVGVASMPRHAFYDRTRQAFAVVATSEARSYGCLILIKGVL